MSSSKIVRDVNSPSFGVTVELMKPKHASLATRREYARMMEERALMRKSENYQEIKPAKKSVTIAADLKSSAKSAKSKPNDENIESTPDQNRLEIPRTPSRPKRPVATATVFVRRDTQPEVKPFPLGDNDIDLVDGSGGKKKDEKHLEASSVPRAEHRARMCMISAVSHMKCLAARKAKSIKQLRKLPITTLEEEKLRSGTSYLDDSDEDDVHEVGDLSHLKSCRYLRGVDGEKELSVEEIFH